MAGDLGWTALQWPGAEHVVWQDDGPLAVDSMAILAPDGVPVRVGYRLTTDAAGRTTELTVTVTTSAGTREVGLHGDGDGRWHDNHGTRLAHLDGCIDVDLSHTPLTNTLPVRRLDLAVGASAQLVAAYVRVPELALSAVAQTYTCLDRSERGGRYRYRSGTFVTDLEIDSDGFVLDYPTVWRRLAPPPPPGSDG